MTNEDDRARIRGYIVSQAQKYDVVDLWPRVLAQRTAYLQAIEGMTQEQAAWRPPSGEGEAAWSALEVTQHMTQWTRNVIDMVEAMAAGREGTKLPVGSLDADLSQPMADARRALARASMDLGALIARPGIDADLSGEVSHPLFGALNIRGWLLFQRVHDIDHVNQVEALKAMDGFPAAAR